MLKCELCDDELKGSRECYYGKCTTCTETPKELVKVLRELVEVLRRIEEQGSMSTDLAAAIRYGEVVA